MKNSNNILFFRKKKCFISLVIKKMQGKPTVSSQFTKLDSPSPEWKSKLLPGSSRRRRWKECKRQKIQMLFCALGRTGKCTPEPSTVWLPEQDQYNTMPTDTPMWMVKIHQHLSPRWRATSGQDLLRFGECFFQRGVPTYSN